MKMFCPITGLKFVGTISLGLLTVSTTTSSPPSPPPPQSQSNKPASPLHLSTTHNNHSHASPSSIFPFLENLYKTQTNQQTPQGISYTTTTTLLPSLTFLPSASQARQTLSYIQQTTTRQILTLASISSLSLITAYSLASPRNKHPYLLWVALTSFLGGQGVELYYNGLERFYLLGGKAKSGSVGGGKQRERERLGESGYVDVDAAEGTGEMMSVNGEKVEVEMNRERWVQGVRTAVAGLGCLMGVVGIWGDGA